MRAVLVSALAAALLTAGCSTAPDPRFADEGLREISCMAHQPEAPGPRYTDPARRRTGEVLPLLRYYTANGAKPYCDGAGPTDIDKRWARLYAELGADATKVAALLE